MIERMGVVLPKKPGSVSQTRPSILCTRTGITAPPKRSPWVSCWIPYPNTHRRHREPEFWSPKQKKKTVKQQIRNKSRAWAQLIRGEEKEDHLVARLSGFGEHVGVDGVWVSRGVSFQSHGSETERSRAAFPAFSLVSRGNGWTYGWDGSWVMSKWAGLARARLGSSPLDQPINPVSNWAL